MATVDSGGGGDGKDEKIGAAQCNLTHEEKRDKEIHLKLAGVIKGVHAKLRQEYRQSGNLNETWEEHCKNESLLSEYADAMHHLATEHWSKRPETRIDWCRHVCHQYFYQDDGLKNVLEKEERKKKYEELAQERVSVSQDNSPALAQSANHSSGSLHAGTPLGSLHLATPRGTDSSLGGSHTGTPHLSSDDLEQLVKDIDNCPTCSSTKIVIKEPVEREVFDLEDPSSENGGNSKHSLDGAIGSNNRNSPKINTSNLLKVKNDESLPRDFSLASTLESGHISTQPIKGSSPNSEISDSWENLDESDLQLDCSEEDRRASFIVGDEFTPDETDAADLEADRAAVYGKYKPVQYNTISLPFSGKIRLLDVGSCFNPFLQYEEFHSIGIDISPAVESVYHCDFLSLDTTEPLQVAPDTIESYLNAMKSPVERIPSDLFHVVVFSLLLEYFPSPYQRWICCQKAHNLLMMNGLLLIITPDSHSQHKNAGMMKSWKKAIESLGFKRWKYVKQEHLHCMAFRKVTYEQSVLVNDISADMLYIPQDFNETEKAVNHIFDDCFDSPPRTDDENEYLTRCYMELPDLIAD